MSPDTAGQSGTGSPAGIAPTTSTMSPPLRDPANSAAAAVAARMPINGPGRRGARESSAKITASTAALSATVGQRNSGTAVTKERTCSMIDSPETVTPVSRPSWLATIIAAMPARYPTRTGRESRFARKPSRSSPATRQITPTSSASVAACAA